MINDTALPTDAECITAGAAAWAALTAADKVANAYTMLAIGHALLVGRRACPGNQDFGNWCEVHGFADMSRQDRAGAQWMALNESIVLLLRDVIKGRTSLRHAADALKERCEEGNLATVDLRDSADILPFPNAEEVKMEEEQTAVVATGNNGIIPPMISNPPSRKPAPNAGPTLSRGPILLKYNPRLCELLTIKLKPGEKKTITHDLRRAVGKLYENLRTDKQREIVTRFFDRVMERSTPKPTGDHIHMSWAFDPGTPGLEQYIRAYSDKDGAILVRDFTNMMSFLEDGHPPIVSPVRAGVVAARKFATTPLNEDDKPVIFQGIQLWPPTESHAIFHGDIMQGVTKTDALALYHILVELTAIEPHANRAVMLLIMQRVNRWIGDLNHGAYAFHHMQLAAAALAAYPERDKDRQAPMVPLRVTR